MRRNIDSGLLFADTATTDIYTDKDTLSLRDALPIYERKAKMAELADAFIALPGGCGTMEELMEIITWKQLNLFNKPIIIYNINNYYDHLIKMLDHAISQTFMSKENASLWEVANSVEDIYNIINKES